MVCLTSFPKVSFLSAAHLLDLYPTTDCFSIDGPLLAWQRLFSESGLTDDRICGHQFCELWMFQFYSIQVPLLEKDAIQTRLPWIQHILIPNSMLLHEIDIQHILIPNSTLLHEIDRFLHGVSRMLQWAGAVLQKSGADIDKEGWYMDTCRSVSFPGNLGKHYRTSYCP